MKKSDLKTGMVVESREGEKYLVFKECVVEDCFVNSNGYDPMFHYEEDLKHESEKDLDLVKIYSPNYISAIRGFMDEGFDSNDYNLIWETQEPKEYTVEQLEEIIGHKIKIVGE